MPILDASVESTRGSSAPALAREIEHECDRALRLLDRLLAEQDEVLLEYTRGFVRRAAGLNRLIAVQPGTRTE